MDAARGSAQNSDLPQQMEGKEDRWSFWPATVALTAIFILVLVTSLPGAFGFLVLLLSMVIVPSVVGLSIFWATRLAVRRRFRMSASFVLAILIPIILWKPIVWASDVAHLALTLGLDAGQNSEPMIDGRFTVYDWSVGLAGNPGTFLVRDPVDGIASPPKPQKNPVESNGLAQQCTGNSKHLIGHYYICTF